MGVSLLQRQTIALFLFQLILMEQCCTLYKIEIPLSPFEYQEQQESSKSNFGFQEEDEIPIFRIQLFNQDLSQISTFEFENGFLYQFSISQIVLRFWEIPPEV